jgi:hypothetical protein
MLVSVEDEFLWDPMQTVLFLYVIASLPENMAGFS